MERGLLHPFIDYDELDPVALELVDPMDDRGNVRVSDRPGLGLNLNHSYIESHSV